MAEVLQITDGSTTINLLNTSGIEGLADGWVPNRARMHDDLFEVVKEVIEIKVTPASEDDLAVQLIALEKLLWKAWQFHNTTWQTTPVYLQATGKNETGVRYALLHNGGLSGFTSVHDFVVKDNSGLLPSAILELWREAGWRDAVPGDYPSAKTLTASSGPASPTEVHVTNHVTTSSANVPIIKNFDDNLAAFSADLSGGAFTYFEVSGSTPAVGDIIYFGSTSVLLHNLVFLFGGGGDTFGVVPEYYNGSWTELTLGTEYTTLGLVSPIFRPLNGRGLFTIGRIDDAVKVAIDGDTAYWIRLRISSVSATAGRVTQVTDAVYTQWKNHVEIPATAIDGDLPPHIILSHIHPNGSDVAAAPEFGTTSRIIMGLKSTGISTDEKFPGAIVFDAGIMDSLTGGGASVIRTPGVDASVVTDVLAPAITAINVDFAGDATLISRIAMELNFATVNLLDSFGGTMRAFLRVKQASGNAGDCSVKMVTSLRSTLLTSADEIKIASEEITLGAVDKVLEVVDMGIIDLVGNLEIDSDTNNGKITFDVLAARSTGSATLRIYDIVLIPINEWSASLDAPVKDTDSAGLSLHSNTQLEMDTGVVKTRVPVGFPGGSGSGNINIVDLAGAWNLHGEFPILEPSKLYRLYYLMLEYNGAYGTGPFLAPIGKHLVVEVRAANRYSTVKGSD